MLNIEELPTGGSASNVYLLWDETGEGALIDASVSADVLTDVLDRLGVTLKYILVTHAHFDHIYELCSIAETTGAIVAVGRDDLSALRNPDENMSSYFCAAPISYRGSVNALGEGERLKVGNMTVKVGIYPGHTPGLAAFFCDDAAFVGDLLFRGSIGRTDFPRSSHTDMKRSLRRLLSLPRDMRFYPGHGDGGTLGYEFDNNYYLLEAAADTAE